MECAHKYIRNCTISAPCCNNFYQCRFCHDDSEEHEIDRFKINRVKCNTCGHEQKVSASCEGCEQLFGKYFCGICNFFDNVDKEQFHCDGCGLCRVGGRENFFHCTRCNLCIHLELKEEHKCLEGVSNDNCVICMEDLHSSTDQLRVLKCRHVLHQGCYESCLKSGHYACPVCNESTMDMQSAWELMDEEIANVVMPEEFRNIKRHILCRDCHVVTETLFHVLGMKCQKCGSYNTTTADSPAGGSGEVTETPLESDAENQSQQPTTSVDPDGEGESQDNDKGTETPLESDAENQSQQAATSMALDGEGESQRNMALPELHPGRDYSSGDEFQKTASGPFLVEDND